MSTTPMDRLFIEIMKVLGVFCAGAMFFMLGGIVTHLIYETFKMVIRHGF